MGMLHGPKGSAYYVLAGSIVGATEVLTGLSDVNFLQKNRVQTYATRALSYQTKGRLAGTIGYDTKDSTTK